MTTNNNSKPLTNNPNLKPLKNGDLLIVIASALPLVIWIYFVIKIPLRWLYSERHSRSIRLITKQMVWCCILLPFIVVIYNFYSAQWHSDYNFNTAELSPGWQFCLSTKDISTEQEKKGLVARWDLKCGLSQINLNSNIVNDLVTRFYYLSNALFIFVLVIYNSLSVDILKTKHITQTMIWCLLFGIFGMLPSIFNTYYFKTFLFKDHAEQFYQNHVKQNIPCEFYKEGKLLKEYKPK